MAKRHRYKKLIRDGKVAVLYSPGYGAGWSTWCDEHAEAMLFDRDLVELVLADKRDEAAKLAEERYEAYTGGARGLQVAWLPEGTAFKINEYDGSESILTVENLYHIA